MRMSKSKLMCYCDCPLQFKWRYIDKLPEKPNEWFERGKELHTVFEKFFPRTTVEKDFSVILKGLCPKGKYEEYENFLNRFQKIQEARQQKLYFIPYARELEIIMKYKDIELKGFVDAVHQLTEDTYSVVEYKTSYIMPDSSKSKSANKFSDYMFELIFYAWMVQTFKKIKVTHVELMAMKNGKHFIYEIQEGDFEKMLKTMEEIVAKIRNKEFFKNPNKYCFFCSYKENCMVL